MQTRSAVSIHAVQQQAMYSPLQEDLSPGRQNDKTSLHYQQLKQST